MSKPLKTLSRDLLKWEKKPLGIPLEFKRFPPLLTHPHYEFYIRNRGKRNILQSLIQVMNLTLKLWKQALLAFAVCAKNTKK